MNREIIPIVLLIALVCVYPPVTFATGNGGETNESEEIDRGNMDEDGVDLIDDNQNSGKCILEVEQICSPKFWAEIPFGPITPVTPILD